MDGYWTLDISLFTGTFRSFGRGAPIPVRGKVHTEQERYRLKNVELEIIPIAVTEGVRTYVHLCPFVLIPDVILTIGVYPEQHPDGAIGEVIAAHERKMKEVEIGNVQAWMYADGTLVLWECFLHRFVRQAAIHHDPHMAALWRSIEAFLLQQFPQTEQIMTTARDPMFPTEDYQSFLACLGYVPLTAVAYGKRIVEFSSQQAQEG